MGNERKKIAVFICAISFDNQRKIVQGILKRAKERGDDIYLFTCHVGPEEDASSKKGMFAIMDLPDIAAFDGVILLKNSIQDEKTAERLARRIRKSGIPAVSIDEHMDGMHNIGVSSYRAQRRIVEHLTDVHGMRRIAYVTGRICSQEAQDRYQAYLDVLSERGIFCDPSLVYFGNYDAESGRKAVRKFWKNKKKPEAIVFANDGMAIGGLSELEERGVCLPEDVAVTGFDNDELARIHIPSVTTVDRRQKEIGYQAMCLLEEKKNNANRCIRTETVIGESCGCRETVGVSVEELRITQCGRSLAMQQAIDAVKNMSVELAGLSDTGELYEKLQKYVSRSDMRRFYLCICDETKMFQLGEMGEDYRFTIPKGNHRYTKKVSIPLAYENGTFGSYGAFPSRQLLPDACMEKNTESFYTIFPIAYRDVCFGYCVVEGSDFALKSEIVYSWVGNIGIALENIRKYTLMEQMVKQLNTMWMYDMLTHAYNRMGFYHFSGVFLQKLRRENRMAYLLFLDLDGLKKINDTLGHEFGDRCISEMADTLRTALPEDTLLMRYGGDEFVALGGCADPEQGTAVVKKVQSAIAQRNQLAGRSYTLAASMGITVYRAADMTEISGLIERADKRMYEEKEQKRKGRG